MSADFPTGSARKPRADAERNRQKLLDAARSAFTAHGAQVSMEEVARLAGVGIGTLYRHFPNRSDLVVEVYRTEISKLVDEADVLSSSKPPLEALKGWLLSFVDHLADHIVLGDAVKALAGEQAKEDAAITDQLKQSLNRLFERPIAEGTIADPGIEPLDFLRALYGIATASPSSDWDKAARRMIDVLINGLAPADARA